MIFSTLSQKALCFASSTVAQIDRTQKPRGTFMEYNKKLTEKRPPPQKKKVALEPWEEQSRITLNLPRRTFERG